MGNPQVCESWGKDPLMEIGRQMMIEEDADILLGRRNDRVIRFDEYRLGDCIEERDRTQFKRRMVRNKIALHEQLMAQRP